MSLSHHNFSDIFPLSISSYLSAIEQRVENVEDTLQSLQRQITGLSRHGQGKSAASASPGRSSILDTGLLEVQEVTETNDSVDAMGALVFANEEETGFFGRCLLNADVSKTNAALITGEARSFIQYRFLTPRLRRRNACH